MFKRRFHKNYLIPFARYNAWRKQFGNHPKPEEISARGQAKTVTVAEAESEETITAKDIIEPIKRVRLEKTIPAAHIVEKLRLIGINIQPPKGKNPYYYLTIPDDANFSIESIDDEIKKLAGEEPCAPTYRRRSYINFYGIRLFPIDSFYEDGTKTKIAYTRHYDWMFEEVIDKKIAIAKLEEFRLFLTKKPVLDDKLETFLSDLKHLQKKNQGSSELFKLMGALPFDHPYKALERQYPYWMNPAQEKKAERLEAIKKAVLVPLRNYSSCWKFSIFGHHHENRARAIIKAITNATTIDDVQKILLQQRDVALLAHENDTQQPNVNKVNSALLDDRWQDNDRSINKCNMVYAKASCGCDVIRQKGGGFTNAISEALNKFQELYDAPTTAKIITTTYEYLGHNEQILKRYKV